ncbi:MAG: hypothetical protein F9K13_11205 [Candidatus Methylomirabilis oxygeniifera]|uniref:Uncharacterized protein n=1 Tax=Methylomirabilis oxygeniifera TaxID=671143 RepID=D5MGU6_METO1|nr:MAG: hypothetical protein F9K13_11205 [Candidatus Methylomirabilis oxyfera]CBE68977.1 protein of unknown function [Candidatus Methylomirabilis oxyfera]
MAMTTIGRLERLLAVCVLSSRALLIQLTPARSIRGQKHSRAIPFTCRRRKRTLAKRFALHPSAGVTITVGQEDDRGIYYL